VITGELGLGLGLWPGTCDGRDLLWMTLAGLLAITRNAANQRQLWILGQAGFPQIPAPTIPVREPQPTPPRQSEAAPYRSTASKLHRHLARVALDAGDTPAATQHVQSSVAVAASGPVALDRLALDSELLPLWTPDGGAQPATRQGPPAASMPSSPITPPSGADWVSSEPAALRRTVPRGGARGPRR